MKFWIIISPWSIAYNNWSVSVMNCTKILNNCACNKLELVTWGWLLDCIFRAGLEQEIDDLKNKLAACKKENQNLQEELSEAYHIKTQLAGLHNTEVLKNAEAEKQVKFFQTCVAAAFAERDNAIVEAEKAKEKEEVMSLEWDKLQKRVEELTSELLEEKKLTAKMQIDRDTWESQIEAFKKVINKFYAIKAGTVCEETSWEDKCESLLHDSAESWSFCSQEEETSTSNYISALEQELGTLRKSMDNHQNNMRMGLEIENHLQRRVCSLEKEKFVLQEKFEKAISELHDNHSKHRTDVIGLIDEGNSFLKLTISRVEEKIRQLELSCEQNLQAAKAEDVDSGQDNNECRDVHANGCTDVDMIAERDAPSLPTTISDGTCDASQALDQELQEKRDDPSLPTTVTDGTIDASQALTRSLQEKRDDPSLPTTISDGIGDASQALAQALEEKVAALLLLSQEEERYLLDRNLYVAIQRKVEELKRNLLQVTNEKVKALMELAQLKHDYQVLQEKPSQESRQGTPHSAIAEKKIVQERDGRLKNLLKKTYLSNWVGRDLERNNSEAHLNYEGKMDFARMKIENATLKESLENMEHLTSSVRRLRHALFKMNEPAPPEGTNSSSSSSSSSSLSSEVDSIINEATLVRMAIGSSLPISWSAEADQPSNVEEGSGAIDAEASGTQKVDFVSAAGYEMVELLIFAAHTWKEYLAKTC